MPLPDREPDLDVVRLQHDRSAGSGLWRTSFGLGRHEMARIGVLRPLEHVGRPALLDDRTLAHDVHAVCHVPHDAQDRA